jgi:hypothetical protein
MSVTDHDPYCDAAMSSHALHEIRHSRISLHHAKTGYDYPTIRLPHTLTKLVGLSTRIYQTVHGGALAFLVVMSARPENAESANRPLYLHGEGRAFESSRAHLFFEYK